MSKLFMFLAMTAASTYGLTQAALSRSAAAERTTSHCCSGDVCGSGSQCACACAEDCRCCDTGVCICQGGCECVCCATSGTTRSVASTARKACCTQRSVDHLVLAATADAGAAALATPVSLKTAQPFACGPCAGCDGSCTADCSGCDSGECSCLACDGGCCSLSS